MRARGGPARVVLPPIVAVFVLAALAAPSDAIPEGVTGLTVEEATFRTVNITFNVSASVDVHHYRIYVSNRPAADVANLSAPPELGTTDPLYDVINVTSPANASGMQVSASPRVFFDNATEIRAQGRVWQDLIGRTYNFIPSDAAHVYYTITNLEPNVTRYVAVTPVDNAMVENTTIQPIPVVAADVPVERLPGNESILLTLGGIFLALFATFAVLAKTSSRTARPAYLYVAPAVIGLAILTFYPVGVGIFLSFTNRTLTAGRGGFDFDLIGFDNYARVFDRPEFGLVAATTIVWTVVNVFFHVAMGLVLAVLLNRKIMGRAMYRTLFLLPWAIPSYISVIAWRGMFDRTENGVIDALFGGSIDWLYTMPWALVAVIITNVWLGIPFMMMVFSGGLQSIPADLYEAADVDGLTRWQKFRRITLPLLKPTVVPASLLGFIWTFNMFNVIYLMTQGGPVVSVEAAAGNTDILITYVYKEGFSPFWRQGFAAAYSVVIFFMLLAFGFSYTRYTRAIESVMGERARLEPGRIAKTLRRLTAPVRARLVAPLRRATNPDQPETVDAPAWVPVLLLMLGAAEFAYGASVLAGMGTWITLTATHGAGFGLLGALLAASAILLAAGRSSGLRLGVATGILEVAAGLLAPLWLNVPLLLLIVALALLVVLTRTVSGPATRPAPLARLFDRASGAWAGFVTGLPRGRGASLLERGLLHSFLISFAIFSVFPLLMVVGTAFSNIDRMATANIPLFGQIFVEEGARLPVWNVDAFARVTLERPFLTWLKNSLLVSAGTTLWGLFVALPAGYGFSRFSFTGKRAMMLSFLVVQMFPGAVIIIPYYLLMQQLRLLENPVGLILAYSVTALPFMVWMLKGFFDTIPRDLEEAAMTDGASQAGAFLRVILPLSLPALAVTALFSFMSAWNEWLLAFTFMSKERNFTLPVGISSLAPQGANVQNVFWNEFAALSVLVSLPVVVLFIVFQRYLISGLTSGAVKG